MSRYRFIEVEKVNHAVRTLCRVLQVSRTAYYHWSRHPLSDRALADIVLTERIAAIHARSPAASYRPEPGSIPTQPGVYRFRDERGRVIYVGKAKSLRQRLNSYFADLHNLHARTRQMVTTAASVEWTVVSTEVEALQQEYTWIKEYDPRFTVRDRDEQSYPSQDGTREEELPVL